MPHITQSRETAAQPSIEAVYAALDQVYDPELDAPITDLQFVAEVAIEGDHVLVRYNVPTFWCAPNFVFMMSHDIRHELAQVPGVGAVTVLVSNNCVEDQVNAGVNAGKSFEETFSDDIDGSGESLEELRRIFTTKGFLARQDVLLRRLRQAGLADEAILDLSLDDLVVAGEDLLVSAADEAPLLVRRAAGDLAKYLHKRRKLGLPTADALVFSTLEGQPLREIDLASYLRRSRAARLNIAFNTSLCEGLLRTQFHPEQQGTHASVGDSLLTTWE